MTYLIFDLIILAVLAVFVQLGRRKGFVLALCGLLAVFVAFLGASFFSELLAAPAAKAVVPAVERGLRDAIGSYYQFAAPESGAETDQFFASLPLEDTLTALQASSLYKNMADSFRSALEQGTAEFTANAVRALAEFIALKLVRAVIFLIAFAAVLLGWTLLSHALDLAFKLPVLDGVNRGLGGAMGLIKGALVVFILCWLFKDSLIPHKAIEQTFLLKFFCENSPLSLLAMI